MAAQLRGVTARARFIDRAGRYLISIGGIGIIVAVLGIFVFILRETYPLFQDPEITELGRLRPAVSGSLLVGMDPYHEITYVVHAQGIDFQRLADGQMLRQERPVELATSTIVAAHQRDGHLTLGLDDGRILLAKVSFVLDYPEGKRIVKPLFRLDSVIALRPGEAIAQVVLRQDEDGNAAAVAVTAAGDLLVVLREKTESLLGGAKIEQEIFELQQELVGEPTAVLVDGFLRQVLVATDAGQVAQWRLQGLERPQYVGTFAASDGAAITVIDHLLGDISLVVGDAAGQVSTWFKVEQQGQRQYRRIHQLQSHKAAVTALAPSMRDKQFLSADAAGSAILHHMTSEQNFSAAKAGQNAIAALAFAPKADGFLQLDTSGQIIYSRIDNAHPEITIDVLAGEIWYEGYNTPEYVWQSTGGSDDFESKLSVVPLVFGTAKGTLYALLFALPLAILAAIYTAEFANPRIRAIVKPTIEVMASLPSVILGFLGGLWLAPLLEREMVGTLVLFPLVPSLVILASWGWQFLPQQFTRRVSYQAEIYILVGLSLVAGWLAYMLGPAAESLFFGGNFQQWLVGNSSLHYDQRNCLVVGFAMGFAVIPLVFTICEDALSTVPRHLRAGSLALGATRWQTAVRVVLPMAVPGIFSAAMIGFGRAVGETMIVLMATGNTPIMDWNIFNGMRTISANIAVELPEAPHQGTLYRILFLSGLLLFAATFVVNTVAEVVRQRLREKYNRL